MVLDRDLRLAINGYGRIGRCFLRALQERSGKSAMHIVAINEPANLESMAYLTQYDSTHGRFHGDLQIAGESLLINGHSIAVCHERNPEAVDWKAFSADVLVECSGVYGSRRELNRFVESGCSRVLLSQPGHSASDVDATVVYGVNHQQLTGEEVLVSAASCTTNAVVPVLALLDRELGLDEVLLTTLHSVMNDQPLIDGYHHNDLRRTRSAMQSIIPVSTGLARGVERLLPELTGKVQAKAIRVPTLNVSAIDLTLKTTVSVDKPTLNRLLSEAARGSLKGLVSYSEAAHASIDFNHDPHSAIVDGSQTRVVGSQLVNVFLWFDNEWGFVNRMLDVLACWQTRCR
jgi:D-erythrose 4-phosphate dehydrogenase